MPQGYGNYPEALLLPRSLLPARSGFFFWRKGTELRTVPPLSNFLEHLAMTDEKTEPTAEQKTRWIELCQRDAALALALGDAAVNAEKRDGFQLYKAEIEKVAAERDAVLREMIGDDTYREYQSELESQWAGLQKKSEDGLRALVGNTIYEKVKNRCH